MDGHVEGQEEIPGQEQREERVGPALAGGTVRRMVEGFLG